MAHAAEPAGPVAAPPGLQPVEAHHDFGRVNGGTRVAHDFILANPASDPVKIHAVKSSCGCLVVGDWPRQIEGGGTGTIPVHFDTANYAGHVRETVTVTCADPALPPLTLSVEATVWWPIEVTPRSAVFEFGANSGTNAFRVVRIVNREETPLELREPRSSQQALAATLRTNQPGQEFELTIATRPPLPAGNIFGRVELLTSSTGMPVIEIPVSALLQPDVVVTPSRLVIPGGGIRERMQQVLSIRSFWTNALELASPAVNRESVGVRLDPVAPGRAYEVTLTYPEGFAIPAGQRLELRVETNHPRYRILRVPINAEAVPPGS